jgi:hypothetical protein
MDDDILPFEEPEAPAPRGRRRLIVGAIAGAVAAVLLYYAIGVFWVHRIDDDVTFQPAAVPPGAAQAVAMASALVQREVNDHHWTANDPFFLPGWLLDNMPNYQQGILSAVSRFARELTDQLGRTRGSSQADPDLETAAGRLSYPGDIWVFDTSAAFWVGASSESQYREGLRSLRRYNERLASGDAVLERRADNLLATIERIAADVGSASATLERQLREGSGAFIDFRGDDVYYSVKGKLYAYGLLLRALGQDYAPVIAERQAQAAWAQTVESLLNAASLEPWVVVNGAPDGQFLPSHLAAQGFYLLRARTQLREIANILLK